MATALDDKLAGIMAALTAPGAPLETDTYQRYGVDLVTLKNAPPTMFHLMAHYCNEHKDKEFIVDGDIRMTFGEAFAASIAVGKALVAHGVKTGDRIGIAARNSANWIVAYMGVLNAGGCATLLNGWWTGEELADGIDLVECSLVLADRQRAARLDGIEHGAEILVFDHGVPWNEGLGALVAADGAEDAQLPALGPDDLATVLYTSGSTGKAKGAWSDHRGVVHGVMSYAAQSLMVLQHFESIGEAPGAQPSALVVVPLFHVTGEVPLFLQSFALGRKLVLTPKWDAVEAMRLIEQEKVSYFVGVPLMSYEIATHPDRDKYDLSSCQAYAAGGAPRPVDHVTKIKDKLPEGFPLLGYGLTETNAVGCGNFNENYLAKPGSTGRPSEPLVDLAILDDDGNEMPQGEMGEICIRSICNFLGYWNDEKSTKEAILPNGFFRTGDLGYLDEDDYLFIVDRKKDIIIRGGENIACLEVEQAIYGHDDIAECSVFGLPDDRYGELPYAVYLAKDGASLSEDELREYVEGRIAKFKVPVRFFEASESLPRLGTAKIDRRALRNQYAKVVLPE
ncbi:class I adenylate-forming enzyme family protein [Pseudoblastomonas halimionae]|uniref:AMP-binding protein n=1 Tax=Alteriqipengyuania halimionae TaxID=1926630 RepID=A0A6I4U595_9SPHN|nr:class I adenylate-forming enzyme family protein [Alteriqipengyuania halimionae]MXP11168.1 AMP-binding protein [Alteriqipengyuania halimionae]